MMARSVEKLTVAFQGELGAFSHSAVLEFFGKDVALLPLPNLHDVFDSLSSSARFAVVPIENSRGGDIGETIDLLQNFDYKIVGEVILPVKQCLIIHKRSELGKIRRVMSHPQALAQCSRFLDEYCKGWQRIPAYDTAGAVKMIAENELFDSAAIASELACKIYSMKLVKAGIEDDPNNVTRFIAIAKSETFDVKMKRGEDFKTSIIFQTMHKPGSLVAALRCLSEKGINLLKIVSRPIQEKHWEYSFYVEFEGSVDDKECEDAIKELKSKTTDLKILGSYPHRELASK
jgi:prephenate dehydratase